MIRQDEGGSRWSLRRLLGLRPPPSAEAPRFRSELALLAAELAGEFAGEPRFDQRMEQLCLRTRRLLRCDRCSVFLREGDHFRAAYNSGNPPDIAKQFPHHRVRLDDPLVNEAIREGHAVTANDARSDPRMNKRTAKTARIHAISIAPVIDDEGEALGFITAEFNETEAIFEADERELFEALGRIVSLAIRHEAARRREARREESLREAHHLASIGRYAGGLAHDLNNRLTAAIGHADLLLMKHHAEPLRGELEELARAIESTAELTGELLELATGARDGAPRCDLGDAFASLPSRLRPIVPPRMELVVDRPIDHAWAPISSVGLGRIVTNLVLNAAEANDGGGRIVVRLARGDEGAGPDGGGRTLVIEVEDDGPGIPDEDLHRVFEPSFTTKPGGTGLGLSIVRSLVEEAGGRLDLDSPAGGGSCFRIQLPEIAAPDERDRTRSPLPPRRGRRLTMLVADDDEGVRQVLARAIEERGHEVATAPSAQEAIRVFQLAERPFDVLVSDLEMPDMDGRALARALRSRRPGLSVLFVSAFATGLDASSDADLRKAHFLAKPFGMEALVRTLANIEANGRDADAGNADDAPR